MSKIAVICNTLNEYHKAKMGLGVTLRNAGREFDLFLWDNGSDNDRIKDLVKEFNPKFLHYSEENVGNPVAYNQMLLRAYEEEYDYIVVLAPDHVMPNRWLELMTSVYERAELKGFLAFQPSFIQEGKQMKVVNNVPLEYSDYVFGCWFFERELLDTVGFINEEYKYYGKWDSDYNFRLNGSGVESYYLPIRKTTLTSSWKDNSTDYRKFKDKWLAHNEKVYNREVMRYVKEGSYYVAPPIKLGVVMNWKDEVRVFGMRRSGTNMMEWVVREHFYPHYNGIAVIQDNLYHNKQGKYENLKHCLPTLEYSDKIIVIFKPYAQWVESVKRIGYTETSQEAWSEHLYHSMKLPTDKCYLVDYNDFIDNYEHHVLAISEFLDEPINQVIPLPKLKFNRDGGKTLSNKLFCHEYNTREKR